MTGAWRIVIAGAAVVLAARGASAALHDVNGDGQVTVCTLGDSQLNDPDTYRALARSLPPATAILKCAMPGRKIGDVLVSIDAILDGDAHSGYDDGISGRATCVPIRGRQRCYAGANDGAPCSPASAATDCPNGTCGLHCDYAMLLIIANNAGGPKQAFPSGWCSQRGCTGGTHDGAACRINADCGGGTCTNRLGPQNGQPCDIPSGTETHRGYSWIGSYYCDNGDNIGDCCSGLQCPRPIRCGSPGQLCRSASREICGPRSKCRNCSSDADCIGDMPPTSCRAPGMYGSADITDDLYGPGWCVKGEPASPRCPKGLCLASATTTYLATTMQKIIDAARARTRDRKVVFGLIGNPDPFSVPPSTCLYGPKTGSRCQTDADCPSAGAGTRPPKCVQALVWNSWRNGLDTFRWFNRWERDTAASLGLPYVDLAAYFRRRARVAHVDIDTTFRDGIHFSALGQRWTADLLTACWTNARGVPENLCRPSRPPPAAPASSTRRRAVTGAAISQ